MSHISMKKPNTTGRRADGIRKNLSRGFATRYHPNGAKLIAGIQFEAHQFRQIRKRAIRNRVCFSEQVRQLVELGLRESWS